MTRSIRIAAAIAAGASVIAAAPAMSATQTIKVVTTKTAMLAFRGMPRTLKEGTYTFAYTNRSGMGHNLKVGSVSTPTFSTGTKTITVTLKKGKVAYECSVPGHAQAGMKGTITVIK